MFVLPIMFLCSRLEALPSVSSAFEVGSWEQTGARGPREKPGSASAVTSWSSVNSRCSSGGDGYCALPDWLLSDCPGGWCPPQVWGGLP